MRLLSRVSDELQAQDVHEGLTNTAQADGVMQQNMDLSICTHGSSVMASIYQNSNAVARPAPPLAGVTGLNPGCQDAIPLRNQCAPTMSLGSAAKRNCKPYAHTHTRWTYSYMSCIAQAC